MTYGHGIVPSVAPEASLTALVVSIVDDDASVRAATARLLRSHGFAVFGFASPMELLESPHLNETACIVTDVRMPRMSGVDLQNQLLNQGRQIPMIFITAFRDEGIEARVLAAGAAGFLTKPFDAGKLIDCVSHALLGRGSAQSDQCGQAKS